MPNNADKSFDKFLEQWLWNVVCAIRGAKDVPKYKDYLLPLVFAKRLCDVFDDEVNRIAPFQVARVCCANQLAR